MRNYTPVATKEQYLQTQKLEEQVKQLQERLIQAEAENKQLRSIDPIAPDAPDAEISRIQTPPLSCMTREDNTTHRTSQNNNTLFTQNYRTLEESSNTSSEAEQKSCCDDDCINDCGNLMVCTSGCCECGAACCECIGLIGSCVAALS
jgi:hypothetical protein